MNVLLMMDSVTRVAMAQRQIGLAAGEPPATKGYTPSVFALLPKLLERSGRVRNGSITGFYSVLVEGDDLMDPICDAVRGIVDGHMVLSRALANRGHWPAVSVLDSLSRLMIDLADEKHYAAAQEVRRLMAVWQDIEDLVNIGAYAAGHEPGVRPGDRRQAVDCRVPAAEDRRGQRPGGRPQAAVRPGRADQQGPQAGGKAGGAGGGETMTV